jgi:hypothetical protein
VSFLSKSSNQWCQNAYRENFAVVCFGVKEHMAFPSLLIKGFLSKSCKIVGANQLQITIDNPKL